MTDKPCPPFHPEVRFRASRGASQAEAKVTSPDIESKITMRASLTLRLGFRRLFPPLPNPLQ